MAMTFQIIGCKWYGCILIPLLTILIGCTSATGLYVDNLQCERMDSPLGIDILTPGFSWKIYSNDTDVQQIAYRIIVSESIEKLRNDEGDCWDSQKVSSDNSIQVFYDGLPLEAKKTYYWKVKVWDNKGKESAWSDIAHWKMGLLSSADWGDAEWIALENVSAEKRVVPGIHFGGPDELGDMKNILPCLRKKFAVKEGLKSATAYVSGLGHFEMSLNGQKVGNHFLDPGWTNYDKYALYLAFDILPYLVKGDNACGIMLGNGFYHTPRERYRKCTISYGAPKAICKILLEYNNGTKEEVITDRSWKCSPSPIVFSSIYGGESYDARLEQKGWNTPDFDDSHWQRVLEVSGPPSLHSQISTPLAVMETIPLKKMFVSKTGRWIYDLGQNFSGIINLKVKAQKGQTVRLWPAELLDDNDDVTQGASGGPFYFEYTASGEEGGECWQPMFTYYGFRYVMVENAVPAGTDNPRNLPEIQQLEGLHTRNAAQTVGTFTCSNELFNRIFKLIDWSVRSNMASVVTDCPHREKLGWLEVTQLMGNSIHYTYNINRLYAKVIKDMHASQLSNGLVPDIAPEYVVFEDGFRDSPEWGSAYIILPWYMYQWYGDKRPIVENYEGMKRYVSYLSSKADNHIVSHGLGDWFDLGPRTPGESQLTSIAVTATATYYYDVCIMAKAAQLIDRDEDYKYYQSLAEEIKSAFNERFFNSETKQYDTGSQTANALAIYMGFVDEADKDAVFKNIMDDLKKRNYNQTPGEIGFRFLLNVLEQEGESETIFTINNRDDVPGYGFQLAKGATALTESWAALRYVSNNHCMLGHLMEWLYSGIGGIYQSENSIAYKDIIIQPEPVGDLRYAKATYETEYGTIISDWKREGKTFSLYVEIPVNTMGTVYFPYRQIKKLTKNGVDVKGNVMSGEKGRPCVRLGSGKYHFVVEED